MTAAAQGNFLLRSLGVIGLTTMTVLGSPWLASNRAIAKPSVDVAVPDAVDTEVPKVSAPDQTQVEPVNRPTWITNLLQEMDAAANQQQLKRLLRVYSPNFSHSDGLTRQSLKTVIKTFWKQHQDLTYKTELLSWEADQEEGGIATTKTVISGLRMVADKEMALTATVHSRQRWENRMLVEQTVTAEASQLVSGEKPPQITVTLPQEVKVGETYNFDVIVSEPLSERLLLGTAISENISADRYFEPPKLELEPLPAGGLFKQGTAPKDPASKWISAVLVQDGGMIMISRRLTFVRKLSKTD